MFVWVGKTVLYNVIITRGTVQRVTPDHVCFLLADKYWMQTKSHPAAQLTTRVTLLLSSDTLKEVSKIIDWPSHEISTSSISVIECSRDGQAELAGVRRCMCHMSSAEPRGSMSLGHCSEMFVVILVPSHTCHPSHYVWGLIKEAAYKGNSAATVNNNEVNRELYYKQSDYF